MSRSTKRQRTQDLEVRVRVPTERGTETSHGTVFGHVYNRSSTAPDALAWVELNLTTHYNEWRIARVMIEDFRRDTNTTTAGVGCALLHATLQVLLDRQFIGAASSIELLAVFADAANPDNVFDTSPQQQPIDHLVTYYQRLGFHASEPAYGTFRAFRCAVERGYLTPEQAHTQFNTLQSVWNNRFERTSNKAQRRVFNEHRFEPTLGISMYSTVEQVMTALEGTCPVHFHTRDVQVQVESKGNNL